MISVETVWIRLRYERRHGQIVVSYADSLKNTHAAPAGTDLPAGWTVQPLVKSTPFSRFVLWPVPATGSLLAAVAAAPSWREGAHATGPVPVAVLIDAPLEIGSAQDLEATTGALLETLGVARSKYSISFDAGWTSTAETLELPLDIAVVGIQVPALDRFARAVGQGIRVEHMTPGAFNRRRSVVEVLVTNSRIARSILRESKRDGPRLMVVENYERGFDIGPRVAPAGTSIVGLPFSASDHDGRMVEELVAGVVHDLALHESVATAGRAVELDPEVRRRVRVITSPTGLEQLRLDPVLDAVRTRVREYAKYRGLQLPTTLASELAMADIPSPISVVDLRSVDRAVDEAAALVRDFTQETRGLVPIAGASDALEGAAGAVDYMRSVASYISSNPELRDKLEKQQERRATIWLSEPGVLVAHDPRYTLARDTDYDLHVGVGIDWPHDWS